MKKRIFILAALVALIGVASVWSGRHDATAADTEDKAHAGHDHDDHGNTPVHSPEPEGDAHDHENGPDGQDGHGENEAQAEERHGEHAGHGHDEQASSHDEEGHGSAGGICPEHGVPEEQDALCHGDQIGELQPGEGMMVRLASIDVAERAGVTVTAPQTIALAQGLGIPGRVEFNRNRLARITPLSSGVVRQVHVRPGTEVAEAEVLARIAMPEISSLKARFLAASARKARTGSAYLREKDLLERGISSRREFERAESEHLAAASAAEQYRQQLLNYGLSDEAIRQIAASADSGSDIALRAPFSGTVVEVNTAAGEAAEPGASLFTIADLGTLWIELSIPESRIYQARIGSPVQARFDGLPGKTFTGRIFQIGAVVDERTRTLRALAEVENPNQRLRVGMFGDVRLLEGTETQALAIPAGALQSIDGLSFVFVPQESDLFELRRVQAAENTEGMVPIVAGLAEGEQVVSSQGFALKSEVLKARLGASCADH